MVGFEAALEKKLVILLEYPPKPARAVPMSKKTANHFDVEECSCAGTLCCFIALNLLCFLRYEKQLLSVSGMGPKCVPKNTMTSTGTCTANPPSLRNFSYPEGVLENMVLEDCSCGIGTQQCPEGAAGVEPPKVELTTGDILFNLTGKRA